jgi:ribosomal protein S1
MAKFSDKDLSDIQKLIDEKVILWGEVQCVTSASDNGRYLVVTPQDAIVVSRYRCIIKRDEADAFFKKDTLAYLVGYRIPFTVVGVDEEKSQVLCSRKKAQEAIKESMRKGLEEKRELNGTIFGFVEYGAFVEVGGLVGLLKKSDFSTDYSNVDEYMKEGDRIKVRCKAIEPNGQISWEVKNKQHRKTPFNCDLETGMTVVGTVIGIGSFSTGYGIFVKVAQGVDALCSIGPDMDVAPGNRVTVYLNKVEPSKNPTQPPRVRGRIRRVL